jgi:hypothetical protein
MIVRVVITDILAFKALAVRLSKEITYHKNVKDIFDDGCFLEFERHAFKFADGEFRGNWRDGNSWC